MTMVDGDDDDDDRSKQVGLRSRTFAMDAVN